MKKILFIEDNEEIQKIVRMVVDPEHTTVHQAFTLKEAYEKFDQYKNELTHVYIDGCVPGNVLNTVPLIKYMREKFDGPIIAISSNPGYQKDMIAAGCCTEQEKTFVHHHIRSL